MNLRSLRLERGLSQAALAERIGTTQQTIARWETGKSQINIMQLRTLAAVLGSSVAAILDETAPGARHSRLPRQDPAALLDDRPFGTLTLEFQGRSRSHPIARAASEALGADLATRDPARGAPPTTTAWLIAVTLDGRQILINPLHLDTLRIFAESPDHPLPDYLPRPVQQALCRWPATDLPGDMPGDVHRQCEAAIARHGDQLAVRARRLDVVLADGRSYSLPMNRANTAEVEALEQSRASIARAAYLCLLHDDGQHHFANLDHVALIDAPSPVLRGYIAA